MLEVLELPSLDQHHLQRLEGRPAVKDTSVLPQALETVRALLRLA
jgi:hypothetical protein